MTLTVESVSAVRAQLWESGFRPVPIMNADAPGPSPGKRPLGDGWREAALRDPPFCVMNPAVAFALNTGILCDGLRPIDIDVDDPTIAKRVRAMAVDRFGEAPIRMRRNSPRCTILYRAATGLPTKVAITGKDHKPGASLKVEVLGAGQQFVAMGTHDSGADLEWFPEAPGDITADSLPTITEDDVLAFLTAVAPLIGAEPPGRLNGQDHYSASEPQADPLRVASAVAGIPNAGPADWETWNRIGMAIWAATGGSAIGGELFNEWSKRHPAYDPAETEARWLHYRRSPPTSIGAGTLFHLAREGGALVAREVEEPPAWVNEGPDWESVDTEAQHAAEPPESDEPNATTSFPATRISMEEWNNVPPRERIYGHFLFRKFISAIGAPGGAGKTAYAFGIAFAVATYRNLLKEQVHESGAVWIYNLEDPRTELLRRVKAAAIAHGVSFAEISDRLFLDSGRDRPLVIAKTMRDGSVVAWPQVPDLIAEIKARGVRLLIVDPFVRSHRVEENHNDQVDFVAALWAQVADQADCAVLLIHHFKKGGVSGDASAFRGASALIDASRAAVTLTTMSAEEAQRLSVTEKDRWQYVRVDSAKLNLAPPPEHAVWLHLTSVDLENGADGRESDNVQTVMRWEPPSAFEGMTSPAVVRVLERLRNGPGNNEQFYLTGGTTGRWAGLVIMAETGKTESEAKRIIAVWKRSGLIKATKYDSAVDRKERSGMEVDEAMFQELRRTGAAEFPQ